MSDSYRPTGLWDRTPYLSTERLILEPLRVFHAASMTPVLADPELYEFTGGHPPTQDQLERRYMLMYAGSRSETEHWHNWIVSRRGSSQVVGHLQATVWATECALAWTTGLRCQGQGFATEGATATRDWLASRGANVFIASIHPAHAASQAVASSLGLSLLDHRDAAQLPTGRIDENEQAWASSV